MHYGPCLIFLFQSKSLLFPVSVLLHVTPVIKLTYLSLFQITSSLGNLEYFYFYFELVHNMITSKCGICSTLFNAKLDFFFQFFSSFFLGDTSCQSRKVDIMWKIYKAVIPAQ